MRGIWLALALALIPGCPRADDSPPLASSASTPEAAPHRAASSAAVSTDPDLQAALDAVADAARPHKERYAAVLWFHDGPEAAMAPLSALLGSPDARYYAVRALGELGDVRAHPPLARVLADRAWTPRRYAALAMGQIGGESPEAAGGLEGAFDDLSTVRDDALLALTRLDPASGAGPLRRFYAEGLSTGLVVEASAEQVDLASGVAVSITLTNRTDHDVLLPPPGGVLSRGLYLRGPGGRVAWPWPQEEGDRRAPDVEPTTLAPGAATTVVLSLGVEAWTAGEPVDHDLRPSPPRWALRAGSVRYLLPPASNDGGEVTVSFTWHPAFAADALGATARKDAFWTGKAASADLILRLPPLDAPPTPRP